MRFGFLLTQRCNAACLHCTTSCGPGETTALPMDQVRALMDQAAAIWRRQPAEAEPLYFNLSGGEPFLDLDGLLSIIGHGRRLGAVVTCVTNAYWAASDDKARRVLMRVREAGLSRLAVSTSRFHQPFVKLERVRRAIRIARQLGLGTTLKAPLTVSDRARAREWVAACGAERQEVFPVMPYLRRGATLPDGEYIRRKALPQGSCPSSTVTVNADGTAYPCCMPGAFNPFLALGDTARMPLARIHDRFYTRAEQQALRHRGPRLFAEAVIAQGEGRRLRPRYEGVCDLCAHIAGDSRMAEIARGAARQYAKARLRDAIRRDVAPPTQPVQEERHAPEAAEVVE